jgi:hypothetical protein
MVMAPVPNYLSVATVVPVVSVVSTILPVIILVAVIILVVIVAIWGGKSSEATKIATVISPEGREEKLRLRRFNYSGRASNRDHGREY